MLPGALVVLALSIAYALYGQVPLVEAAFVGIKAAVLVIVIEALLQGGTARASRRPQDWLIAAAAFIAIFFFAVPFPLVIAAAAVVGYVLVAEPPSGELAHSRRALPCRLPIRLRTAGLWLAHLDRAA